MCVFLKDHVVGALQVQKYFTSIIARGLKHATYYTDYSQM